MNFFFASTPRCLSPHKHIQVMDWLKLSSDFAGEVMGHALRDEARLGFREHFVGVQQESAPVECPSWIVPQSEIHSVDFDRRDGGFPGRRFKTSTPKRVPLKPHLFLRATSKYCPSFFCTCWS